jgi:hypothetical protein
MVPAIVEAVHRNVQIGTLIVRFFAGIFERRMSPRTISGPFQIAVISDAAAHEGSSALLELIATISLNLAIINLLPLPILDGGVMLLLLIEAALGRDIDFAVRAAFARAGAALLLVLAAFVIYNDLSKLLSGWREVVVASQTGLELINLLLQLLSRGLIRIVFCDDVVNLDGDISTGYVFDGMRPMFHCTVNLREIEARDVHSVDHHQRRASKMLRLLADELLEEPFGRQQFNADRHRRHRNF